MSKQEKPKIGQGVLMAAMRQGAKEVSNVLKAFPDSLPLIEEPGQIFNATQVEVSQQTGHSQMVNFSNSPSPSDRSPEASEIDRDSIFGKALQDVQQSPELDSPELEIEP